MLRTLIDPGVVTITLNEPPANLLTRAVLAALRAQLASLAADERSRALVLRAEGRHFSAGASVQEHLPGEFETMIPEFTATILALHHFPLPVIAAVRGRCLGGGFELAQAADVVIAAEDAVFGQPEIHLGVFPPAACALLPLRVRPALAAELIFTGEALTAQQALEAGIAAHVVPAAALDDAAYGMASEMARHSAAALRAAKRALRAASVDVEPALERAADIYTNELMRTADAVEGLRAFLEKRPPKWSHR